MESPGLPFGPWCAKRALSEIDGGEAGWAFESEFVVASSTGVDALGTMPTPSADALPENGQKAFARSG